MKLFCTMAFACCMTANVYAQSDKPLELKCNDLQAAKSEVRSVKEGAPQTLITTPVTQVGDHVPGLAEKDFFIHKGKKVADILRVEELKAVENTTMRIVFMVDNSQSMSPHLAVLESVLKKVISGLSNAVRVSVVFFSEAKLPKPSFDYNGKALPLVRLPYTYDKKRASDYVKNMLAERLLTRNTYLYDGVYGVFQQIAADTGTVDRSFCIVFSDGADTRSTVDPQTVLRMKAEKTIFYTIDYLTEENAFLVDLARQTQGEHFLAKNANDLTDVFDAIAKKIVAKGYEIAFRFKDPPQAEIDASTDSLIMEEEIVRETFPLLNYVFFDQGSAALSDRYTKLTSTTMSAFDESAIQGGAMDYYYHLLNIIGFRMRKHTAAVITVNGYLNDTGNERKNTALAADRAKAIQSYLMTVWGIDEHRIEIGSGPLPPIPSTSKEEEGRVENRRAEITSDSWDILKPVTFIRRDASLNPSTVQFAVTSRVPEGVESWQLDISQKGTLFDVRKGTTLEPRMTWNWKNQYGQAPASSGDLSYVLSIMDKAGDAVRTGVSTIFVREVRREKNMNIVMEDGVTKEKIGLILFPFDVAKPGERNERILEDYVYPRIARGARIHVTGFTDMIGTEEYNLRLSQNRALEVHALVAERAEGTVPAADISFQGVGETAPMYSNETPEGRFYNRTVSLLIERLPVR